MNPIELPHRMGWIFGFRVTAFRYPRYNTVNTLVPTTEHFTDHTVG